MLETCLRRKTADVKINLRGATTLKSVGVVFTDFNSLPIRGRTRTRAYKHLRTSLFQSTPSYEGEPFSARFLRVGVIFQSTPSYEGEQHGIRWPWSTQSISIHSLIRGRTATKDMPSKDELFQSTPSYEGEPPSCFRRCWRWDFNPLPHTRENGDISSSALRQYQFQSTPSYEGELNRLFVILAHGAFQSTPSYEGEREMW